MKTAKAWKIWAAKEPYYAVITSEKYLAANQSAEVLEDFFSSGELHLANIFEQIKAKVDANFQPTRALDFGCGTGRVLLPLGKCCESAVGVDVSEEMLAEAQHNAEQRENLSNVQLLTTAQFVADESISYDFVHSHIVFQHIRPKQGEALVAQLLQRLQSGGVSALQFVYRWQAPVHRRLLTWLKNRIPGAQAVARLVWNNPHLVAPMEMNSYSVNRLLFLHKEQGMVDLHAKLSEHLGIHWITIYAKKGIVE
ncbi:MAG: class I SAM-dependent methyltransferase [Pseudomonadales bacterium]